jgi:hypothetical protein
MGGPEVDVLCLLYCCGGEEKRMLKEEVGEVGMAPDDG